MTGGIHLDGTRFASSRNPLRGLIFSAYGVPYWRLSGGPDWLDSDAYDIAGTFPGNTPQDQVKLMLQTLFADRFKLAIHREMKDYPVYALVVHGKGRPKLKKQRPMANTIQGAARGTFNFITSAWPGSRPTW